MNTQTARKIIVSALDDGNVFSFRDVHLINLFLSGEKKILISDLLLDSLSSMEICIAIELSTKISISPEELMNLESLDDLVDTLMAKNDRKII